MKRRSSQRGFSVLVTAVSGSVLFGMLGLAVDLGRMFIVKSELQTFTDASALAACRDLDGTGTGVTQAHNVATAGPLGSTKPNGYDFDTKVISNVTDTYATSFTGTYVDYNTAKGSTPNNYQFMKVNATASIPLYFLAVIPGLPTQQSLSAVAVAGQMSQNAITNGGLAPFSPDAHDPTDHTNFGLTPNQQYSLKWGNGNTTTCLGDIGFNPGNAPPDHGFVDIGQGEGTSNLRTAIVYGGYPNSLSVPSVIDTGDQLGDVTGNRGASIFSALGERSLQDPDQTSLTWEQYKAAGTGNYRRVVTVAINDPALAGGNGSNGHVTVIGFANFLLDPGLTIAGSSGPICGTYIGPGNLNGSGAAATDATVVYSTALFQ
jgi:Flp pilus assembly protein TadG